MNEIYIDLTEPQLKEMIYELPKYANGKWKYIVNLEFDYHGTPNAFIVMPYSIDSWRKGIVLKASSNVKTLSKDYLTVEESKCILQSFYDEVLKPFAEKFGIKVSTFN